MTINDYYVGKKLKQKQALKLYEKKKKKLFKKRFVKIGI